MCDHLHPAAARLAAGAGLVAAHLLQHGPGLQQTGTDRYVDTIVSGVLQCPVSSPEAGVIGVEEETQLLVQGAPAAVPQQPGGQPALAGRGHWGGVDSRYYR